MSNILSEEDLARLNSGALVKDCDDDYFEKQYDDHWQRVNRDVSDGCQNVSDSTLSNWQPKLAREDVGQPQGPRLTFDPNQRISEPTLTEETRTYNLAGEVVIQREITPSVVLDARANFVNYMDEEGFDNDWASSFFTNLVREGHVTDKFLLDYAIEEN